MGETTIEWVQGPDGERGMTWNPIRGCSRISPGCGGGGAFAGPAVAGRAAHGGCYAEGIAARFSGPGQPFHGFAEMTEHGGRWTRKVALATDKLDEPLRRRKPTTWFISMSDLFHEALANKEIAAVFGVMAAAHWHTFQILTKRGARLSEWMSRTDVVRNVCEQADAAIARASPDPDKRFGAWRKWHAMFDTSQTAWTFQRGCAAHAFASREPDRAFPSWVRWPLPHVHLGVSVEACAYKKRIDHLRATPAAVKFISFEPLLEDLGELDLSGIQQVIVGAESGRGARLMNEDWVRNIRDQAKAQGVAMFFKQKLDGHGRKVSLPVLDGQTWAEMPTP